MAVAKGLEIFPLKLGQFLSGLCFSHSLMILFGRSRPFRWRQLCFLIGRLRKILVTLLGQVAIELTLMGIEKNTDASYP